MDILVVLHCSFTWCKYGRWLLLRSVLVELAVFVLALFQNNHRISWVERDPQGSMSPTPGSIQKAETPHMRALPKCLNSSSSGPYLHHLLNAHHPPVNNLFLTPTWPSPDTALCHFLSFCCCHQRKDHFLSPRAQSSTYSCLNFTWLVIAQPPDLPRSLCKVSLPPRQLTAPHNLVLPIDLLNTPSSPISKSLIKTLKRTRHKMDPQGSSLVTGCQPDVTTFPVTLGSLGWKHERGGDCKYQPRNNKKDKLPLSLQQKSLCPKTCSKLLISSSFLSLKLFSCYTPVTLLPWHPSKPRYALALT